MVKINGKNTPLNRAISIKQLLLEKNINLETVVVEYNGQVLKSPQWPKILLKDNDILEIISFVGGGCPCPTP